MQSSENDKRTLVVVGSGIKSIAHFTTESLPYINHAEKVFYLVNEPVVKQWLHQRNPEAESLDSIYNNYPLRIDAYRAITDHVLKSLQQYHHIVFVIYGHPTVFSKPALDAAIKAKSVGIDVKILPGISAEDCLFADLMIDPGTPGLISLEATDFLIRSRFIDNSYHVILWQVGIIGMLAHPRSHDNKKGATILLNHLKLYYPENHQIILYEAAQYPEFDPRIERIELCQLPSAKFSALTTLYIPPARKAPLNDTIIEALEMNLADLK